MPLGEMIYAGCAPIYSGGFREIVAGLEELGGSLPNSSAIHAYS